MTISMRGVLRAVLIGAIVLAQVGAMPKKPSYDASSYLHPKRLIDVGGRRMNIICSGTGSPTVILDAGLGNGADIWRLVQPKIARHTRVCSYDRAGMGFSDPAGPPRDAAAIVSDLHALLRGAGVSPPYVLVGHSIAGLYTRLYTDRYPNEVAGLVLVDPPSEYGDAAMARIAPQYPQASRALRKTIEQCAANVSRGTCALFPGLEEYRKKLHAAGCPKVIPWACAVAEVIGEHEMRASYWRDEALELDASEKSSAEVRAEQRPYGDLPLIVLTDSEQGDIDAAGPFSLAQQRAMWRVGEKLDERMARLSSVGAHFVVDGSTHMIQVDHPMAIVSAVDEVVDQARYK